jgi:hypothetical protein
MFVGMILDQALPIYGLNTRDGSYTGALVLWGISMMNFRMSTTTNSTMINFVRLW